MTTLGWNREQKIERIVSFFRSGEKEKKDYAIGMELEHFVIDAKTKARIPFEGPEGVHDSLIEIIKCKCVASFAERVIREGEILLGVETPDFAVSIEPGAQFELSMERNISIENLENQYQEALNCVERIFREKGQKLLTIGYDPIERIENIDLLPKDRYRVMNRYLGERGKYSRNMMRQSCALQVIVDYSSEDDFKRKYRTLSAMTPILYTLFDSIAYFEGKLVDHFNMRQEIWRATDPARTGVFEKAFDDDFGYRSIAEWVLGLPTLFVPVKGEDGKIQDVETGEETLESLLDKAKDEPQAQAWIEHALSIVFPDIRVKKYLEIRVMDEVPRQYAFGAAAMFKGLLYDETVFDELEKTFRDANANIVERGKNSGRDNGIQGYYFKDYFAHWGIRLLDMAKRGLEEKEQRYLEPLYELWGNLDTPRTLFERIEKEEGMHAAIEAFEVQYQGDGK